MDLGKGKWRFKEWNFGKTIFVGETVKQRERVLGICPVIIVVEGMSRYCCCKHEVQASSSKRE